MKKNGNNERTTDYFIGLDVGTNSVGWAATDEEYNVLRFKGNSMWGIRLFDEAKDASGRRGARTARRRLERRKERLRLLENLFNDELHKRDPLFLLRLSNSSLYLEDKAEGCGRYSLFNDKDYTDADYLKQYPTVYHLRSDLIHSTEEHDIRLVFLAIHHILKNRGHFLIDGELSEDNSGIQEALKSLAEYVSTEYSVALSISDLSQVETVLLNSDMGISAKKKELRKLITADSGEDSVLGTTFIADMLAGAQVKLADLFNDNELKDAEIKSVTLKSDIDEIYDKLCDILQERADLILELKRVYDTARLTQIKGEYQYISDSKIALYDKNHDDLKKLKKYVREYYPDKYSLIFSKKSDSSKGCNNYAAYSGYNLRNKYHECKQEEFCSFLKAEIPALFENDEYADIAHEIENKTFLSKLKGTDNGVIPNQLHRMELKKILENASSYLEFLNEKDEQGFTVKDKILSIFDFRIPYYVGPLNPASPNAWLTRSEEKIYPWNFEQVVNLEQSAQGFIKNLIGKCTYTGERVIPADSLLYSKYEVLNEINLIRVDGNPISVDAKQKLYEELFVKSTKKVTKKTVRDCLIRNCYPVKTDSQITGMDDVIKARLKSLHDFERILEKTKDEMLVESIIQSVLVFGDDKKMLRQWLKKECKTLDEKDINYICKLRYKDWGRFSREFLTEIYTPDQYGELHSIIDMLWETNCNLMQLLSGEYAFMSQAEEYKREKLGTNRRFDDILDDMYLAPRVKRSVHQTIRIVDEIVDARKSAPEKIFVEVAREHQDDKGRTVSRKQRLLDLYKACKEESKELLPMLENEKDERLRSDKLYLYYTQFGKCMYSGEPIDLDYLADNTHYDIDHIFPQSRIKDDSLDNRVLVKSELNRDKTNDYPIKAEHRNKMEPTWRFLKEKGLISEKKYSRLVRSTPLTVEELSSFVARQITETQQSTKALATILKQIYPQTKIVYSKAGNVSDFRQQYGFTKFRSINDLHHAKDAYLNIVVGNVYDTKFTSRFFENIENEKYSLNKVFEYNTKGAWDASETIKTVRHFMSKNNILYTRMPYKGKGQLFDLQIVAAGKGQLPVKKELCIEKYGGYNKVSGSFFCAVEHLEKKKRIRTIEPIYLYAKHIYDNDPIRYCRDVLNLIDPVIICPEIRVDSLLEFDGMKLNISGRSDNRILYKHAFQFVMDQQTEKYYKSVFKFVERNRLSSDEPIPTSFDVVNAEDNIKVYDLLSARINERPYSAILGSLAKDVRECRDSFISKSIYNQCVILTELAKAFKCNSECPNFTLLNGKKTVGIVRFSNNITKFKTAYLVNQSISGLYSYRQKLL